LVARHHNDDAWLNMRPPVMAMDEATTQRLFQEYDGAGLRLPVAA